MAQHSEISNMSGIDAIILFLRDGHLQQSVIFMSILWIQFNSISRWQRKYSVPKLQKGSKVLSLSLLDICGLALRNCALVTWTVASLLYQQPLLGPNAKLLAYAAVLDFTRIFTLGAQRQVLSRQSDVMLLACCLIASFTDILPSVLVNSTQSAEPKMLYGTLTLFLALLTTATKPRERVQPDSDAILWDSDKFGVSPEEVCSWFDYYCSFGRMGRIIWLGWKENLGLKHLPNLPWHYNPEILRENVALLRLRYKTTGKMLFMLLWRDITLALLFAVLFFTAELIVPFGLYQLLEHLRRPEEALVVPYVWVFVMFAGQILRSVMQQQSSFTSNRMSIKLKMALTSELYQSVLMSRELEGDIFGDSATQDMTSQRKSATGQLSNLISSDVKTLIDARVVIMIVGGIPMGCIASVMGLYSITGWPCLVGLAVMFLGSFITAYFVNKSEEQQESLKDVQDSRISVASEFLRSMKVVKCFGWEDIVVDMLNNSRSVEQHHLWKINLLLTAVNETAYSIPVVALLVIFALYVFVCGQPLTASVAYTAINLLEIVRDNFTAMSIMGFYIPKAQIALRRLDRYFMARTPRTRHPDGPLGLADVSFRRNMNTDFQLQDITIDFISDGLNVVIGPSGSGKTTLLMAILGEGIMEEGRIQCPRNVAFVSQSPWLQAMSIRENILFNSEYDQERYEAILRACCLEVDLLELPLGDETDVGDDGRMLSGGQRARVALARALYSDAPLLLLDDIFSAIDARTGIMLWNRTFCSDLIHKRTVVLVTQLSWVPQEADLSVTLEDGQVSKTERRCNHIQMPRTFVAGQDGLYQSRFKAMNSEYNGESRDHTESIQENASEAGDSDEIGEYDETRPSASSNRLLFLSYISYFGDPIAIFLTVATLVFYNAAEVLATLWMTRWVDSIDGERASNTAFYLGVYVAISMISTATEGLAFLAFMRGCWVAAKRLHSEMVSSVVNVSLSWFSENPTSQVLNRLSEDMDGLDQSIAEPLTEFVDQTVKTVILFGTVSSILPVFLLPAAALSAMGTMFAEIYSHTSVSIKRLVLSSQSPLISHTSGTLKGLTVIRARRDMVGFFTQNHDRLLLDSAKAAAAQNQCDQWLKFRINFLAALINISAGLLALFYSGGMSPGLIGFSLSRASELSGTVLKLVFQLNDLNVELQSFHRVLEYCRLPPEEEPPNKCGFMKPEYSAAASTIPAKWPTSGSIEFQNVTIRHRLDGPDVLKNINLKFQAGERIALVGRTGSGKSTLMLSILRFTHIMSGRILYDGVDITTIPRKRLRHAISTIPQEPLLFQGTIASNLDPTGSVEKSVLQQALDVCCAPIKAMHAGGVTDAEPEFEDQEPCALGTEARNSPKLGTQVESEGSNFSHGQRQVLSLCRVMIRNSKLMLLDEATANTDSETDSRMQEILRTEVAGENGASRCLITIAHRLRTIEDYDQVVVLSAGEVVEVGSPQTLKSNKAMFYDMWMSSSSGGLVP